MYGLLYLILMLKSGEFTLHLMSTHRYLMYSPSQPNAEFLSPSLRMRKWEPVILSGA